jgi:hypothetical protein
MRKWGKNIATHHGKQDKKYKDFMDGEPGYIRPCLTSHYFLFVQPLPYKMGPQNLIVALNLGIPIGPQGEPPMKNHK